MPELKQKQGAEVKMEAPNVATNLPYSLLKSSEFETVYSQKQDWDNWYAIERNNMNREYRNWRAYSGVDCGQWTADMISRFNNQGRNADQFNVIKRRVDILHGNEMTQIYDFDWTPIDGQRTSGTDAVKETYFCDKELFNYESVFGNVFKNGFIYKGAAEMVISRKYNPNGNISFECMKPGFFMHDPDWVTDDDNDCEELMKVGYFNAKQIKRIWGVDSAIIEQAKIQYEKYGKSIMTTKDLDFQKTVNRGTYGHLYRVIEKNWLEWVRVDRLYGKTYTADGYLRVVPFPITEKRDEIEKFAQANQVNISDPDNTFIAPSEQRILMIRTTCEDVVDKGIFFEGRDEIQINRLKQFHFSVGRALGTDAGIVDDLYDLQQNINKREAKLTNIIETTTGGGKLINKKLVSESGQRERFLNNSTDPSYRDTFDGEALMPGEQVMIDLQSTTFPGQVIDVDRLYGLTDIITPVTSAQTAEQGAANESGVLFERRLAVSRIGQLPIDKKIEKFQHDCAEAYFYQWQIQYDGIPRMFSTRDGKHSVMLNEIMYDSNGNKGMRNRPAYTPRCKVTVKLSPKSESWQMRKRAVDGEMLKYIPKEYSLFVSSTIARILKSVDMSEDEKAEIDNIMEMQKARDTLAMITEMTTLNANKDQATLTSMQIQQMIQQMMGPPQLPQGMEQGGMPPQEQITMEGEQVGPPLPDEQVQGLMTQGQPSQEVVLPEAVI